MIVKENLITVVIDYKEISTFYRIKNLLEDNGIIMEYFGVTVIDYEAYEIQSNIYNNKIAFLEAHVPPGSNEKTKYTIKARQFFTIFEHETSLLKHLQDKYWLSFNTFEDARNYFSESSWYRLIKVKNLDEDYS